MLDTPHGWHTAALLIGELMVEPTSHIYQQTVGLAYPVSREDTILRDMFDLVAAAMSDKQPQPYPRPYDTAHYLGANNTIDAKTSREMLNKISPVGGEPHG